MPKLVLTDLSVRSLSAKTTTDFWDTKLPAFGVRVGPRSKTFILKIGNSRTTIGAYPALSLQEARKRAQVEKLSDRPATRSSLAFGEAYELFKTIHIASKKGNTRANYLGIIDRHFLGPFDRKSLDEISYPDIIKITDQLSPSNQAYALAVIRIFWNFCRRRQLTTNNPVDLVQVRPSTPRDRVLSDDELQCIWRVCDFRGSDSELLSECSDAVVAARAPKLINPTFASIVRLLILTGCRKSEIANLQASWIKNGEISLPAQICKNGRAHTFPIGSIAKAILEPLKPKTGPLFPAEGRDDGSVFSGWSKCKLALDKALGPNFKPWTLHDLRRTFATDMARLGVRLEVTEALLNHVSGSRRGIVGVYQRYNFFPEMVEAINRYEMWLSTLVGQNDPRLSNYSENGYRNQNGGWTEPCQEGKQYYYPNSCYYP